MRARNLFSILVFFALFQSCISDQGVEQIKAVGTVKFISLEGGFYGIVGDDGKHYDPVNLKEEFKQDGLRVRFTARPAKEQVSFHMWGQMIELITVEKL